MLGLAPSKVATYAKAYFLLEKLCLDISFVGIVLKVIRFHC